MLTIGVSIVYPAACHLKLRGVRTPANRSVMAAALASRSPPNAHRVRCSQDGQSTFLKARDWATILVGIVCALSGTSASLASLSAVM